jgi:hypothetical protein
MSRLLGFLARPAVAAVVALALIAGGGVFVAQRISQREPVARPTLEPAPSSSPTPAQTLSVTPSPSPSPVSSPSPTPTPSPSPSTSSAPSPSPSASPKPSPSPSPTPDKKPSPSPSPAPSGPSVSAFRLMGTWVDRYDYDALEPWAATFDMRSKGVRALFVQTGRYNWPAESAPQDFGDPVKLSSWVAAAHARGLRVVGWYLPAYEDMDRDVRRTVAIKTYRTASGQGFDGLAIDIEYKGNIGAATLPDQDAWMQAVATHITRVRTQVGSFPIGAITPAPLGMAIRPERWVGFPWETLGTKAHVMMPMSYWTYRDDCPTNPSHCAYGYTKSNIDEVRRLTKRPSIPIHVIGGVGGTSSITTQQVADFVRAARERSVYGGSFYDYRVTAAGYWPELRRFNSS